MGQLRQWWSNSIQTRYGLWMLVAVGVCGVLLYLTRAMSPRTVATPHIRIMTYNIEGGQADRQQLLALIRQHNPDLVMLQEVPRARLAQWFGAQLQLPYRHFAKYTETHPGGLAILSRWPLGTPHVLRFRHGRQGRAALAAQVQTPAGTVWAASVHLGAPRVNDFGTNFLQFMTFLWREFFTVSPRYQQAQELLAWLATLTTGEWILGGDFNSMPLSRTDRYMAKYFDDVLLQRPWRYFNSTFWDLSQVPITPRIDYIYHSSRFRVIEARVIQKPLSDHYPVLAILAPPTAQLAFLASSLPDLEAMLQKQISVSVAGLRQDYQPGHMPCSIDQVDMAKRVRHSLPWFGTAR